MKDLIKQYMEHTHRIAFYYPRKKIVRFDGFTIMKEKEAERYMRNELKQPSYNEELFKEWSNM